MPQADDKLVIIVPPAVISMANGPPLGAVILQELISQGGLPAHIFDANLRFLSLLSTPEISNFILNEIDIEIVENLSRDKLTLEDLTKLGRDLTCRQYEVSRIHTAQSSRLGIEWAGVSRFILDELENLDTSASEKIWNTSLDILADDIMRLCPSSIAFTALFHLQYKSITLLARRLRDKGFNGPIILGGAATKLTSAEKLKSLMQKSQLDLVYPHDLYTSPDKLIAFLCREVEGDSVPGAYYRDKTTSSVIENPCIQKSKRRDTARLVGPLAYELDREVKYFSNKIFPVLLSEGCYWGKCDFCDYPYLASQNPFIIRAIFRDPKHIVADINNIHRKYGVTHIDLISDAVPLGFFQKLREAGAGQFVDKGIQMECSIRAESQAQSVHFKAMKSINMDTVTIGVEALSDNVLAGMQKGNTYADILRSVELARDAGIGVKANLIVDHPRIQAEDVDEMIKRLSEIEHQLLSIGVHSFSLSPYAPIAYAPDDAGITISKFSREKTSDHGSHTLEFARNNQSLKLEKALRSFKKKVKETSYKLDKNHGRIPDTDFSFRLPLIWKNNYAVPTDKDGDVLIKIPGATQPFEFFFVEDS